jgi:hypothetical protein
MWKPHHRVYFWRLLPAHAFSNMCINIYEAKLFLRKNEVNHMEVPCYQEISVKNLYEDAMKDELLVKYLPTKEQLSGRLPERDFFFGLMCTLCNQYMKDIIAGAHKVRYTVAEDDTKKQAIYIS